MKSLNNIEILMNKNRYWQEPEELRKYVVENSQNIGSVNELNIYRLK